MKTEIKRITFLCVLFLVAGCTGGSSPASYPLVTADEEHLIVPGSGKNTPGYEINPAHGIQLDIGHFDFKRGGVTVTPDTVQVSNHGRYRLAQPITSGVLTLDASTLTNAMDFTETNAFPGFRSGDKVMINVGRAQPVDRVPQNMTYDWEGIVVVQ